MQMTVSILVSDILWALDLDNLPEDSAFKETDYVELQTDIDEDDVVAAAFETNKVAAPEDSELHSILNQREVMELSAAIRRGDTAEAELMLDRIASDDDQVKEWVEQARYSPKAKVPAQALRRAA